MATLTRAQMATVAAAAGLPHPALWAEIGESESSGRTDVVNSIGATGWLQINQPVHVKAHPTWTQAWLKNPLNNAAAARVLYRADLAAGGDGYGPWASSRSVWGATSAAAAAGVGSSSSSSATQAGWTDDLGNALTLGSLSPLQQGAAAVGMLGKAGSWVANPHNWLRVVYVGSGALLITVGLALILQKPVVGVAGQVLGTTRKVASKVGA